MGDAEFRPNWLAQLLGRQCCGPWTPWEHKERSGPLTLEERVEFGVLSSDGLVRMYRWQERRCTRCGKIQQEKLRY